MEIAEFRRNRRSFLKRTSVVSAGAVSGPGALAAEHAAAGAVRSVNRSKTRIGAYYLRAHMYTCVPRHIRDDMEWMADKGTDYVCVGVLEQDIFAKFCRDGAMVPGRGGILSGGESQPEFRDDRTAGAKLRCGARAEAGDVRVLLLPAQRRGGGSVMEIIGRNLKAFTQRA